MDTATSTTSLGNLPNEILTSILLNFGTTSLLRLSTVDQHFYQVIHHITQQRLLEAAKLQEHKLMLECFHPSAKFSSPPLFCEYLDTKSAASLEHKECAYNEDLKFADLYTSFLPLKPSTGPKLPRSHPAGGPLPEYLTSNGRVDTHDDFVCQNVNLDSYELFSQLCCVTTLVKTHAKRGLFLSSAKICDGTARVWRNWLAEQACRDDPDVLWVDMAKTIGLKMKVVERPDAVAAVASMRSRNDEDPAVGYTLMFEALVVKATKLLLLVEQSIEDERKHTGKAIVIGSWEG